MTDAGMPCDSAKFEVVNLGRMGYHDAFDRQIAEHGRVLAARENGSEIAGCILTVEHHPVLSVSRRKTAKLNILASPERLSQLGIEVCETDRGGDVTYHGPGQLVVYPIIDLNRVGLNLHAYMRLLEEAIITTCRGFGMQADREPGATGVWVSSRVHGGQAAKICAMGVRVRRWVTMHGLALNVSPDMVHFETIVPCGLSGRPVTSLRAELGDATPSWNDVRERTVRSLQGTLTAAAQEKFKGPAR